MLNDMEEEAMKLRWVLSFSDDTDNINIIPLVRFFPLSALIKAIKKAAGMAVDRSLISRFSNPLIIRGEA